MDPNQVPMTTALLSKNDATAPATFSEPLSEAALLSLVPPLILDFPTIGPLELQEPFDIVAATYGSSKAFFVGHFSKSNTTTVPTLCNNSVIGKSTTLDTSCFLSDSLHSPSDQMSEMPTHCIFAPLQQFNLEQQVEFGQQEQSAPDTRYTGQPCQQLQHPLYHQPHGHLQWMHSPQTPSPGQIPSHKNLVEFESFQSLGWQQQQQQLQLQLQLELQHRAIAPSHIFDERLSSPEGSLSPVSDQGYFESMTDDELSSNHGSYTNLSSLYTGHLASSLSELKVASPSCGPESLQGASSNPSTEVKENSPNAPRKTLSVRKSRKTASSPAVSQRKRSMTATKSRTLATALPSLPLRQHFSSFSDSEGPEDEESNVQGKRRRKRIRLPHMNKVVEPKPCVKLACTFPGCSIQCSSQPSLLRHTETHKWRGIYAPVRCETCLSALSNEFSVQRHILRAPLTSPCRKMRVYSVMRSEHEVECTVRFYPKRPHGRKTVLVDLEAFRQQQR
ncbi:hypothetical protein BGZ94_003985 [Podila epigama]|nr:hypothetical protein BGZ94_003985 [Podila epigama]